ncbi:MAG: hypothetical protein IK073_06015 [Paludibacteraceae bacterium]|nr:hypothetical protein [Paludibacteraceae bacterium]
MTGQITTPQQPAFGDQAPSSTFRSTSGAYMATGSAYSATVSEVGSYSPAVHHPGGIRRSWGDFSGIETGHETTETFENTQIGSLDDAVLPLLLMALAFAGYVALRRRKINNQESKI